MSDNQTVHIRPRFNAMSELTVEEIQLKINNYLKNNPSNCYGKINYGFGSIHLPEKEQHYWSPQLTISLEKTEEGTEIRGLYGPKASIWTMFVFFYSIIGFGFIIFLIVGLSHISLEKESTIIWLSPLMLILFFSIYLTSYFGKKKGTPQLIKLESFIEAALEIKMKDHFDDLN
jgi:hypothetical protein